MGVPEHNGLEKVHVETLQNKYSIKQMTTTYSASELKVGEDWRETVGLFKTVRKRAQRRARVHRLGQKRRVLKERTFHARELPKSVRTV